MTSVKRWNDSQTFVVYYFEHIYILYVYCVYYLLYRSAYDWCIGHTYIHKCPSGPLQHHEVAGRYIKIKNELYKMREPFLIFINIFDCILYLNITYDCTGLKSDCFYFPIILYQIKYRNKILSVWVVLYISF